METPIMHTERGVARLIYATTPGSTRQNFTVTYVFENGTYSVKKIGARGQTGTQLVVTCINQLGVETTKLELPISCIRILRNHNAGIMKGTTSKRLIVALGNFAKRNGHSLIVAPYAGEHQKKLGFHDINSEYEEFTDLQVEIEDNGDQSQASIFGSASAL